MNFAPDALFIYLARCKSQYALNPFNIVTFNSIPRYFEFKLKNRRNVATHIN